MKTWRTCVTLAALTGFILLILSISVGQFHCFLRGKTRVPQSEIRPLSSDAKSQALSNFGKLPLSFEPNVGQTDSQVSYLARGDAYEVFLTKHGAVLELAGARQVDSVASKRGSFLSGIRTRSSAASAAPSVVRMTFEGAKSASEVVGLEELSGKSDYFIGNDPKNWHTGVPSYRRIKYRDVYSGIDLVFYGNQRRLEYDFIVAPGADPGLIALRIDGASNMRIDFDGNLHLGVADGEAELRKPVIYQEGDNGLAWIIHDFAGKKRKGALKD